MARRPRDRAARWQLPLIRVLSSPAGAWWFINVANPIDKHLVPATNGWLSTLPGQPVLAVETIGRKSGKPRRTPMFYVVDGDDLVVLASAGGAPTHPAWYLNILANPELMVWCRRRCGRYVARTVEGEERERLWHKVRLLYPGVDTYQDRAGARALPVVVFSPLSRT